MRPKKNKLCLNKEEREKLKQLTSSGKSSAQIIKRANVLLSLDESAGKVKYQAEIAQIYQCNISLVRTVALKYASGGIDEVIIRKIRKTPPIPSKITGDIEAKIIGLACSQPPEGRVRWTLRLLEEKAVELKIIDKISDTTIRSLLKKLRLSLIRRNNGASHPKKMLHL